MAETRPRTRWKRLAVIAVFLVATWTYAMIAWLSGSIVWPVRAADYYLHRTERQKRQLAELMQSVPFDTKDGSGFIGLPGTSIWAKVPKGVFGTRNTPASNGIRGLRPSIWWRESGENPRTVIVTTIDAIEAGPSEPFPADSPNGVWWAGLRETAEQIVSDAESGEDPSLAYSIALDDPEGAHSRLDVDLEFGAAVIVSWCEGDSEPPDMWEYFTIGEPVPADGQ